MNLNSHLEIALASIKCFTDDGTIDIGELNFLIGLAMRDGIMDNEEKRVLGDVFNKVSKNDVNKKVWDRLEAVRKEYGI